MIRINLLPVKKARKAQAGQRHLLVMGAGVLVAVGAVTFVHISTGNKLEEIERENRLIQSDIERLKAEIGDYDKVKGQREDLLRQRKTINSLQAGRTGPLYLLREISEILTPNKGPTFDRITYEERLRKDPNVGFNSAWDTRHVWIDQFTEQNRRLKLVGFAKSNEDVAEFLKRLQLSVFFTEVSLGGTTQAVGGVRYVTFTVEAGVVY